jgi:short-subunit dehydrogenase
MNKLVVVTGGTKGIGRAIVQRFAQSGFDVVTCARSMEDLGRLKREVEERFREVTVFTFETDVSDIKGAKKFCEYTSSLNRLINVLINNTGNFISGNVTTEPDGVLEEMIQTNLYSAYHITRGLLNLMNSREKRHIFNLCSIASIMAYPNGGSYTISKFALLGFSKCLREELKDEGIRVTAVMPGATLTLSWGGTSHRSGRFMPPEDIAESIYAAYALSDRTVVEELVLRPQEGDL